MALHLLDERPGAGPPGADRDQATPARTRSASCARCSACCGAGRGPPPGPDDRARATCDELVERDPRGRARRSASTSAASPGGLPAERRPGRVPDRAGVAHQRRAPRRTPARPRCRCLRRRTAITVRGRRRRPGPGRTPPTAAGQGIAGHARAGRPRWAATLDGRARGPAGGFRVRARLPTGGRPMIRVLLADDQALVRAGFRALLDAQDGHRGRRARPATATRPSRLAARHRGRTSC